MKVFLALVAVGVLAIIAATVILGVRLSEDTVVKDPYEAGLRWDAEHHRVRKDRAATSQEIVPSPPPPRLPRLRFGEATLGMSGPGGDGEISATRRTTRPCDLSSGACTAASGPLTLTLDLGPRPVRAMAHLRVAAVVREGGRAVEQADVTVVFAMRGMYMGENRVALAPAGGGAYVGGTILVRCPTGRRDWTAEVTVRRAGAAPVVRTFDLRVAQ